MNDVEPTLNGLHQDLIRCARRLGSRARCNRGDESWLFSEAASLSLGLRRSVAHAGMVEQRSIPVDLEACDRVLADDLERGFARLVFVMASAETFKLSFDWIQKSSALVIEAAKMFARRGRNVLAASACRAGAGFAFESNALEVRDRFIVRSEDYLTAKAPPREWLARTVLRLGASYGYAPGRVFWIALAVVAITALLVHHLLHLTWLHSISVAVGDYFTLGGATEYGKLSVVARLALASEALIAVILNGFFVTLLARRWFRA